MTAAVVLGWILTMSYLPNGRPRTIGSNRDTKAQCEALAKAIQKIEKNIRPPNGL